MAAEACSHAIQRQINKPDSFAYVGDQRAISLENEALMAAIVRGSKPALLAAVPTPVSDPSSFVAAHRDVLQNWIVSFTAQNASGGAARRDVMCVYDPATGAAFVRADDL